MQSVVVGDSAFAAALLWTITLGACDVSEGDTNPHEMGNPSAAVAGNPLLGASVDYTSSLYGCLKSPAALKVCLDTGVIELGNIAKHLGDKQGDWVRFLVKMGGRIVQGGKGSHIKVLMPGGHTEHIPRTVQIGQAIAILKRLYDSIP
jgi:hypothetical protein